jgi:predicted enzyme related to lactoylglutathione lyase
MRAPTALAERWGDRTMPVTGIGGLFFRSRDPAGLAKWYRDVLGVDAGQDHIWKQQAGITVFAPFPAGTDYFPASRQWMLNLRVTDLDALVAKLKAAGAEVVSKPEWNTSYGRFVHTQDPEGNPIELWEPKG